ncbi:hypothetical protein MPC4_170075 [Methylocella tundrae]|uniref:Uncharacterized protein n=1 Tax=Methylocella tundrae TaxID=227605 RepID=A0A8B6M419_METTU|nr:hypothetical protein MPC4_170075 [Methylocella tundrae]
MALAKPFRLYTSCLAHARDIWYIVADYQYIAKNSFSKGD